MQNENWNMNLRFLFNERICIEIRPCFSGSGIRIFWI
jgi:hypothetical protein